MTTEKIPGLPRIDKVAKPRAEPNSAVAPKILLVCLKSFTGILKTQPRQIEGTPHIWYIGLFQS